MAVSLRSIPRYLRERFRDLRVPAGIAGLNPKHPEKMRKGFGSPDDWLDKRPMLIGKWPWPGVSILHGKFSTALMRSARLQPAAGFWPSVAESQPAIPD